MKQITRKVSHAGLLFLLAINVFLSCLFVSWQLNRHADYFYPFFYDQIDIAQHIDKYAPLNRHKVGYESIGPAEHKRVFSEMVDMIHGHGIGFDNLRYYARTGDPIDTVLTTTEVEHMHEVSAVITMFTWFGWCNLFVTLLIIVLSLRRKIIWPSFTKIIKIILIGVGVSSAVMAFIGFNEIFYQFHVLFFSESQWIFSYRESLLIVLTKSPQLFFLLALTIAIPAIVLFILFVFFMSRLSRQNIQ